MVGVGVVREIVVGHVDVSVEVIVLILGEGGGERREMVVMCSIEGRVRRVERMFLPTRPVLPRRMAVGMFDCVFRRRMMWKMECHAVRYEEQDRPLSEPARTDLLVLPVMS